MSAFCADAPGAASAQATSTARERVDSFRARHYKRAPTYSMDIQAAILWEQGQPLSVEPAELDAPGAGEVLVEIRAAGVCHSDLHPARGDWPAKTPLVLGHEGTGIVREVGASVTRVKA